MRLALALAAAALLGGCQTLRPRALAVCGIASVADIPITLEQGRILMPGRLAGRDTLFVLDTGAERSVVTRDAALRADLSYAGTAAVSVVGAKAPRVLATAPIELGGVDVSPVVPVLPITLVPGAPQQVAGLIGADVLAAYDLEISVPERRVRLIRADGCAGRYAPWTGAWYAQPTGSKAGRVLVSYGVNGTVLVALLDTGTDSSVVSGAGARRAGVSAAVLSGSPRAMGVAAGGALVAERRVRFREIRFGPEVARGVTLPVTEAAIPGAEALLGMDFFAGRRVWISYRTRQVFVQPWPGTGPARQK